MGYPKATVCEQHLMAEGSFVLDPKGWLLGTLKRFSKASSVLTYFERFKSMLVFALSLKIPYPSNLDFLTGFLLNFFDWFVVTGFWEMWKFIARSSRKGSFCCFPIFWIFD